MEVPRESWAMSLAHGLWVFENITNVQRNVNKLRPPPTSRDHLDFGEKLTKKKELL